MRSEAFEFARHSEAVVYLKAPLEAIAHIGLDEHSHV